jgi:hypothetical protein
MHSLSKSWLVLLFIALLPSFLQRACYRLFFDYHVGEVARFCLDDDWISPPVFSTVRRIFGDKRYILDKRGVAQ